MSNYLKTLENDYVRNNIETLENNNVRNNLITNKNKTKKIRRSKRQKKMSKKGIQNFKNTCSYFWSLPKNDFKDKTKIKVLCDSNRTKQKLFYGKQNQKYKFIGYEKKFNECLRLYNEFNKIKINKDDICTKHDELKEFNEVSKYLEDMVYNKYNVKPIFKMLFELIFTHTSSKDLDYKELLDNILSGAYCVIEGDNGYLFSKILSKVFKDNKPLKRGTDYAMGGYDGFSTHYSFGFHYRLGYGTLFNHNGDQNKHFDFLIGQRPILDEWDYIIDNKSSFTKYQGDTWFQFEESRNSSISNKFRHAKSTIKYAATGLLSYTTFGYSKLKNIGPFGKSIYTEYNPLVISTCGKSKHDSDHNPGYKKLKVCDIKIKN